MHHAICYPRTTDCSMLFENTIYSETVMSYPLDSHDRSLKSNLFRVLGPRASPNPFALVVESSKMFYSFFVSKLKRRLNC